MCECEHVMTALATCIVHAVQDKALKDIDGDDKKSVSSEYETDEEWEVERKQHLANEQKNTVS